MGKWSGQFVGSVVTLLLATTGCVHRSLTVVTDPPGALVYMNDQEIGRSPVTRGFVWYGFYDVDIRMPGYESIKTVTPVIAPWWQCPPIDFFAEALPLTDHHELSYTLKPPDPKNTSPEELARRGAAYRDQLAVSQAPTTRPHRKPTTKPAH